MKTINHVEIQGFVGRDAVQASEKAPVKFSLATGGDNKADGSGKHALCFHNITAWTNQFPEAVGIRKGDYLRVVGRLNYTKWTGKDGATRYGTEIIAGEISAVNSKAPKATAANAHENQASDQEPF